MRLSGKYPEKTPVDSHGNRPRNSFEKCAPIPIHEESPPWDTPARGPKFGALFTVQ
jgi:hypothetical protein